MTFTKVLLLLAVVGSAFAQIAINKTTEVQEVEDDVFVTVIEGCDVSCNKKGYRAHPSDCRKYLQCAPYGQQEMSCPAGTVWDQTQLRCEHEAAVRCTVGFYKTPSGERCPGQCQFDCPREYGRFPHPRDCRRFFRCKNGEALYRSCGNGKFFDVETSTCVEASYATCNASPDADC